MEINFSPASLKDVKGNQFFKRARDLYDQHDYINALEVIEDLSLLNLKEHRDKAIVNSLQGTIFKELYENTDNNDVKFTYLLASVQNFTQYLGLSPLVALLLLDIAAYLDSVLYYKKALVKAKQIDKSKTRAIEHLNYRIKAVELKIAESKTSVASIVRQSEEEQVSEPKKVKEETRKSDSDLVERLKSCWAGLNVEGRRNFMKVSVAEFTSFLEKLHGRDGKNALEQIITSAKKDRKWVYWMCRTCSMKKFSSADECKNHLEQEHGAKSPVDPGNGGAEMISEAMGKKISVGGWEPVDAVAAVKMIKNQLEDVKAFAYENGWSKDWPLVTDEERSKLLHEIQLLLVLFYDRKVFSCSIQDWLIDFVVKYLENLEVPKLTLTECLLLETPQSICFLQCGELNQILDFLKSIKCERNDGTDLVCRAVESFCVGTRVKEKIDFDPQFSFLLLDKRLLQGKIDRYDDEGTINVFNNPNAQYAKANVHGDDILFWLDDNASSDETFRFPRPIRTHNLDIWVAVLKAIQYTCRTLEAKYEKKLKLLCFDATLNEVKKLRELEDKERMNIPQDQWTLYATRICDEYEKLEPKNSLATRMELSVVRHVLDASIDLTFDTPDSEDSLNVIRENKNVTDYSVLSSIDYLKTMVTDKVPRMDSKILMIENSRINMLNQLTRLSFFDNRSYILGPLKDFLMQGILDLESKAKTAAAYAALLLEEEEEKNKPQSKKKKNKKKKPSMSMSSPLDKTLEHVPEHTVSSETGQSETSSNTDIQEEAAKRGSQLTNIAGENSASKHLEQAHGTAATRCKYALEMTLMALCNIKVLKEYLEDNMDQFPENLVDQVSSAIQSFFFALVSRDIEVKGLYSCLLEDLHASLEARDAAELLVSILEFWPCWKNPEIESVVTHLFTLDEYERTSCGKCGKKLNHPEQSSYGIVIAADSIRALKCAFENMKFEDILKVNRMEDKMLCDTKRGGCGKTNFVHHVISRYPSIFTIVLEWVKNETEEEISETTKALDWEIDLSRLYEGLAANTKYRIVSMVGCGKEDEEYICLASKTDQWFSFRHDQALSEEGDVVGDWKNVVRFCEDRKTLPEILFYEALSSMA